MGCQKKLGRNKFVFEHDRENPLDFDVIILDECSMIGVTLFASFLAAVKPGTILIFIGDTNQLPSVGPGNVLRDMIESRLVPVAELTIIKRQEEGCLIVRNCHAIKNGMEIDINNASRDFYWQPEESAQRIGLEIANLVQQRLPAWNRQRCMENENWLFLDILREVQIITPLKKDGPLSCKELNKILQEALNPNPPIEGCSFREGDKVIQTKNNYGLGIFNGDIGIMKAIDPGAKEYTVTFDAPEREVKITFRGANLELAYAITCHKFQGSEARVIIIPVHESQGSNIMQRNWIYTAISRAREVCILIGQADQVPKIVNRQGNFQRFTNLQEFLSNPPAWHESAATVDLEEDAPEPG